MTAPISRRIERLQKRFMDGCGDCNVTVIFKSGNKITVPYYPNITGFIDDDGIKHKSEFWQRGHNGEIKALLCDNWQFSGAISTLAALWGAEYVEH